jgi:hypothetical protein
MNREDKWIESVHNDETAKQTCRDNVHSCALALSAALGFLLTQVQNREEGLASFELDLYPEVAEVDRLCGPVIRVPGYRSRGPRSIPGATRFSEKLWVWSGVHSASWVQLRSYLEEKVTAPV